MESCTCILKFYQNNYHKFIFLPKNLVKRCLKKPDMIMKKQEVFGFFLRNVNLFPVALFGFKKK